MVGFSTSRLRAALLGGAALVAAPAFAADKPADDAGAKTIADFIAAYAGKAALPSVTIKAEGSDYFVSFDIAAANTALKPSGLSYDSAIIKFHVFAQDDGAWRVELVEMPKIATHGTPPGGGDAKIDATLDTTNLHYEMVLDPKLNWLSSSKGGADKLSLVEHAPGLEEFVEVAGLTFNAATQSGAQGLTTKATEPFKTVNLVIDADPKGVDPASHGPAKPMHISAGGEAGVADISIENFQPGPLLDAWRFVVAHPAPADYARDSAALKPIVTAVTGDHLTLNEQFQLDKLSVTSSIGPVALTGVAFGLHAFNAGPDSGFAENISAKSLKLPDGLVPPAYAPLVPTSFDIAFKAAGFDVAAAAQEWLDDVKFETDGPKVSAEDQAKIRQKLIGGRPVVVDIAPSHVLAPNLDLSFEGQITIEGAAPVASTLTIKVKDFDKTTAAIQGMGPQAAQQLVPALAMAKGLGKPAADGSLLWVCTLGRDHVMKVNGLPLGKSPF